MSDQPKRELEFIEIVEREMDLPKPPSISRLEYFMAGLESFVLRHAYLLGKTDPVLVDDLAAMEPYMPRLYAIKERVAFALPDEPPLHPEPVHEIRPGESAGDALLRIMEDM